MTQAHRAFNGVYLRHLAFPMGNACGDDVSRSEMLRDRGRR